jgi:predicted phosphoribosyltransferase
MFENREHAGRCLANAVRAWPGTRHTEAGPEHDRCGWVVLGIPVGGIVVGAAMARALNAEFDALRTGICRCGPDCDAVGQLVNLAGRRVILCDDGTATPEAARVAITDARRRGAIEVALVAPVGSRTGTRDLAPLVDRLVVLETPETLPSVRSAYARFDPVSDTDAAGLLAGFAPSNRSFG